ncbi:hypothetical protein [Paractinoplanes atraurantiacus]|uniref:FtsX extracellular domain-containing protein n=1 Tax=Paractinoplanes atraurantiacus TaxID=1036182 RepID=A0A285ITM5_9ACTN|nr:hypothetical protein [Actinoplanes atraurantiacus]SNY50291.1 hypothetical protein SAMN05421748_110284 [Actinoplanes atraurantiacus]
MTEFPAPQPCAPPAPARFSTTLVVVAVSLFALLVGAAVGAGGLLLAGFREPVEHTYDVTISMISAATEEQTAAVREVLDQRPHEGPIEHQTSAEALALAKRIYKDRPEVLAAATIDNVGQWFTATVRSATFDCGALPSARKLPGVTGLRVVQGGTESMAPALIDCY